MDEPLHEPLHEAYDVDVAKLNRLAARSAERAEALKVENAELRDFVYDMWNDMNVYYTQSEKPDSMDMDFYRNRMRELGIEVDE